MAPEQNQFVLNPFQRLDLDPARFDPDGVYRMYIEIVNALGHFRNDQSVNHVDRISLGSRKGEEYERLNTSRYEIEYRLTTLEEKKQAIEELFRNKRRALSEAQKGSGWLPQ